MALLVALPSDFGFGLTSEEDVKFTKHDAVVLIVTVAFTITIFKVVIRVAAGISGFPSLHLALSFVHAHDSSMASWSLSVPGRA